MPPSRSSFGLPGLLLLWSGESPASTAEEGGEGRQLAEFCAAREVPGLKLVPVDGGTLVRADYQRVAVRGLCVGQVEVTNELFERATGQNPSKPMADGLRNGPDYPAQMVTWTEAVLFANALSEHTGTQSAYLIDGERVTWVRRRHSFRLPTAAEWEWIALRELRRSSIARLRATTNLSGRGCAGGEDPGPHVAPAGRADQVLDLFGNLSEWVWDPAPPAWNPGVRVLKGQSWAYSCETLGRASVLELSTGVEQTQNTFVGLRVVIEP